IGDFTDFENPQFYDYVTLDYTINDAVVVGNSLYVAVENTDGLQIFDVSDPVQPVFTASFNYSNQAVKCFATDNAYIYAAVDNHGLLVLNPLNLTTPTGALYQSFRSFRLRYNGGQIFAVDGSDNRIQQIDVSNPGLPAILGSYAAVGQGSVISCYNDLAFVGTWQDQLHIVDVSDPNQPTTLGHLDFPCNVTDIDMVEEYIYVGLNNSPGFQIYDLSNPEDPQGAGSLNFGSLAAETIVSGDYLLVAGWDSGFLMVDISEPLNPMIADQLQLSSACMNIAVEGDVVYAYAQSDNSFSIHVIDISDPYNLQELGSMSKSSDFLNNIAVYENTVYIAGDLGPDYGYGMIDVSDPTQPEYIGAIETDIFPRYNGIYVNGNYLYGLYGYEIRQYNLMNPQDPLLIGTIESFVGRDIDFNNDEMYVVTWRQGFIIAEVFSSNHIEETVESLVSHDFAVYPNPFNPQTTITFQIQTSAEVELSIYNSAGQQVSALINRSRLSAGIHDIRWDGSDDVGRKLSSGQYICHLSIDGQIQTTRMILLK
ncbi:MAG: T9SS type A sorting domain-containing protein, partial [Planctomycetes bacterium]|nr:T9SS type A sorting domain-containing protein [Planctomycetota bacterium]